MLDALNDQINAELYSAYLYLSIGAYFESRSLPGFANWMHVQVQEELAHVQKFYGWINERGGRVVLGAIDAPPAEWESPLAAFKASYAHECMISGRINDLVDIAIEEKDHATNIFLQWFVTEQVEEEASTDAVVKKLDLMRDAPNALFMIDRELAQRVFTPPADPQT